MELQEIIDKYGDAIMEFNSSCKHTFYYENKELRIEIWGLADYRSEFYPKMRILELYEELETFDLIELTA